jgi:3-oxoacid CoA-transferase
VEVGEIAPEAIHLPGLYVNRIFQGAKFEHKVEVLRTAEDSTSGTDSARETIAKRAAYEFTSGMNCNLGVGIPTLAAKYAEEMGVKVYLQSENGMIGVGGSPHKDEVESDWINAGKESIVPIKGASTFGSDESFGQIRGGHLDMTVLGSLECSQYGDLANFMIPGKMMKGMGGAMDLVSAPGLTKVMVVQTHCDKYGKSKIKKECVLPLTGVKCIHTIVTEFAVFDVDHTKGLTLREYNPNSSIEKIRDITDADFVPGPNCGPWKE